MHDTDRSREHLNRGLYADYLDANGLIVDDAWRRAVGAGAIVGTCRRKDGAGCCDGYLKPSTPYDLGRHRWYEAQCMRCGQTVVAPHGKSLLRSGRSSEQPDAMHGRRERWKALQEITRKGEAG